MNDQQGRKKMIKKYTINILDLSPDNDLYYFLQKVTGNIVDYACLPEKWEELILKSSPELGKYIIEGIKKDIQADKDSIRFINLIKTSNSSESFEMQIPFDDFLNQIAIFLGIIFTAGGSKVFAELLKIWVEEKKSRKIRIKNENTEIEIQGNVTNNQIEEIVNILETRFNKSKIIK